MFELKKCPCCGGEAKFYRYALFRAEAMVMCPTCRLQTTRFKSGDMEDAMWLAANAWNRRVGEKDD